MGADPVEPLDWQFLQCFGERTPGEEIQEGGCAQLALRFSVLSTTCAPARADNHAKPLIPLSGLHGQLQPGFEHGTPHSPLSGTASSSCMDACSLCSCLIVLPVDMQRTSYRLWSLTGTASTWRQATAAGGWSCLTEYLRSR